MAGRLRLELPLLRRAIVTSSDRAPEAVLTNPMCSRNYVSSPHSSEHKVKSYFKYTPTRVSGDCQCIVSSDSFGNRRSLSTQATPEETTYKALNEIIAAIQDPSVSREELCLHHIQKLCAAGNLLGAARLIQILRAMQILLSPRASNFLLQAAAERNDIALLCECFNDFLISHGSLELNSYLTLARAFSNHNDPAILSNFISEVFEMTIPRIDIVLNRLIFAFGKCGQVDNSLMIFNHMKSSKCKPDLVTYNTMLDILGRLGRVDEILHEFGSMKTANLIPDVVTYNTILNSLRKMGRLELCLVYFKEMSDKGIQPDILTFKALIESLGRSGNVEAVLKIFDEMKRKEINPSVHIYRAIIFSLKKMGKIELALKYSNEMKESLPDIIIPRDFQ